MKQIGSRAVSLLLMTLLIIVGALLFLVRYVEHGQDWAAAYARENAGAGSAAAKKEYRRQAVSLRYHQQPVRSAGKERQRAAQVGRERRFDEDGLARQRMR